MKSIVKFFSVVLIILFSISAKSLAQANDFAQYDCDGQYHHLFGELDSGKVVVMEFVMDCQLCVDAANDLEILLSQFQQQYPGVIRVYQFAYSTLMDCDDMKAFRDSGNFQSEVFEENNHLMAHYGGFGMPTIGVAAGPNHLDIFSSVGFMTSDTAQLGIALRNYFATISVSETEAEPFVSVYPNPAGDKLGVYSDSDEEVLFELFNTSGAKILYSFLIRDPYQQNLIDLSGIATGLYYAKFSSALKTAIVRVSVVR